MESDEPDKLSTDPPNALSTDSAVTPDTCASAVVDAIPPVTRFMRAEVGRQLGSPASMAQIRSLGFLMRNPGASLSALAEHLCVTRATASATIERMVQHGLVERAEDPNERRFVALTVTPSGVERFQAARQVARSAVSEILATLPESKLRTLVEGLQVLQEAFRELEQH